MFNAGSFTNRDQKPCSRQVFYTKLRPEEALSRCKHTGPRSQSTHPTHPTRLLSPVILRALTYHRLHCCRKCSNKARRGSPLIARIRLDPIQLKFYLHHAPCTMHHVASQSKPLQETTCQPKRSHRLSQRHPTLVPTLQLNKMKWDLMGP